MVQIPATPETASALRANDRAQLFACSENLLSVTSQGRLAECISDLRSWLDADEVVVAAGALGSLTEACVVGAGYDSEWLDVYVQERFALVDPIVRGLVQGQRFIDRAHAVDEGGAPARTVNGPTLARFIEAARDHGRLGSGFASGVVINGNLALCSVVSVPRRNTDRAPQILGALRPLLFQALMRVLLPGPGVPHLSPREHAILECLANGYDDPRIADTLSISVSTVRFHLGNVFEKLGARNRCHAVALGFQSGLLRC